MSLRMPFNFQAWIDEHRHLLKPPVCNTTVYQDTDFIIMVVGGPTCRNDYHVDEYEEFFYQLEGEMTLKVIEDGTATDIAITAGEIFLLPPLIPHSPQRQANSVGLVVEYRRPQEVLDGFQWYCANCQHKLHEEFLHVGDIVADLPPVMARFNDNEALRTCEQCGTVMPRA